MQRLLITAIAAVAVALALAQAAQAGPAAPAFPGEIAVTGDHKPYLIAHAEGVQIYACTPVADGYAWRLLAPRATLTADNGKPLGRHYGGPIWQARDGSTVVGCAVNGRRRRPDGGRLAAPQGRLDDRRARRRPADRHQLHPADQHRGRPRRRPRPTATRIPSPQQREVPYSADYVFFKATGS